ncbi:MAG TPA: phosphatidate cytidylyltransferase [Tepidisphaeraceae bacterium]|jgi:phosphatidate cytidylyltransferase|nr:phosphatidate cytidylyltransferase [Tepidisphaeraceae bacterium]
MDRALRSRLTFGPLMLAGLFALLWLDSAAQQWTRAANIRLHRHHHVDYGIGGIGLLILLLIILPIATDELAELFTPEHVRPYRSIAALGSGALALHAFLTQFPRFKELATTSLACIIVAVMIGSALRRAWDRKSEDAIVRMAGTVLATMYLGGLGWFLMAIRVKQSPRFSGSTMVVLMILLVVKSTDIGAYFGGRALGRHKLIRWLSPGKTWEGLFCGMLTAGLVGMGCAAWIAHREHMMAEPRTSLTLWKGFIFGVVIGGIGQVGDLLESLMKRDADVKDSGALVPGFGGVLDIIDSPLFAAPFAYLLFSIFARMPH